MTRDLALIGVVSLLVACGGPSAEEATSAKDTMVVPLDAPTIVASWPGYYADTLPCMDCPGLDTQLWIRSDRTFLLLRKRVGVDSVPEGIIGQWHVVNGLMTVGYTGDKPEFYRYTSDGLLEVDEMGVADNGKQDWSLDRFADEIGDAVPRMRLAGTFTYVADAQSFQPCGAKFSWPCAGGMDLGEEEGEPLVRFNNKDLQRAYRNQVKADGEPWVIEAICTMGMGPAMEGDGADEYVYIEEVKRTLERCP